MLGGAVLSWKALKPVVGYMTITIQWIGTMVGPVARIARSHRPMLAPPPCLDDAREPQPDRRYQGGAVSTEGFHYGQNPELLSPGSGPVT